jgi:hypothetical protein
MRKDALSLRVRGALQTCGWSSIQVDPAAFFCLSMLHIAFETVYQDTTRILEHLARLSYAMLASLTGSRAPSFASAVFLSCL